MPAQVVKHTEKHKLRSAEDSTSPHLVLWNNKDATKIYCPAGRAQGYAYCVIYKEQKHTQDNSDQVGLWALIDMLRPHQDTCQQ